MMRAKGREQNAEGIVAMAVCLIFSRLLGDLMDLKQTIFLLKRSHAILKSEFALK